MIRRRAFLIIFLCWGVIIAFSSIWLVVSETRPLIAFSRKVAEGEVVYYPPRASIVDRCGEKICYTEWVFFVRIPQKQKYKAAELSNALGIDCKDENGSLRYDIPKEKLSAAVKLCRRLHLQLRRNIVRRTAVLPPSVKSRLGIVILYHGLTGIEAEYDRYLQGTPGVYQVIRSPHPLKKIEKDSFRIMSPMRAGRTVRLRQSLAELQCGILPEVAEVE